MTTRPQNRGWLGRAPAEEAPGAVEVPVAEDDVLPRRVGGRSVRAEVDSLHVVRQGQSSVELAGLDGPDECLLVAGGVGGQQAAIVGEANQPRLLSPAGQLADELTGPGIEQHDALAAGRGSCEQASVGAHGELLDLRRIIHRDAGAGRDVVPHEWPARVQDRPSGLTASADPAVLVPEGNPPSRSQHVSGPPGDGPAGRPPRSSRPCALHAPTSSRPGRGRCCCSRDRRSAIATTGARRAGRPAARGCRHPAA